MNISVMANGIVDFFHPGRGERYIRESGFDKVTLSLGCMIAKEKPFVAKTTFPVRVVKAPTSFFYSEDIPCAGKEEVIKAAEVAKKMSGVRYFYMDSIDEETIDAVVKFFDGSGIRPLITNRTRFFNGRHVRGDFSEIHNVRETTDKYGRDRLGFCLDIGEANLCGQDPAEMLIMLHDVTDAVIVKENDGIHGGAYIPFTIGGALDWGSFFRGMRAIDFDGELIFEIGSSMVAHPVPLGGDIVKQAYKMAEYFRWQIEMDRMVAKYPKRVLFGAGNMCRAYMRDYGDKYPPLFTVDNDSKVWGTTFEGLEVKAPDSLKELEKETAIFVCITYYKEVHNQLRSMGLKNPIEYYNDEFPNTVSEAKRLEREWKE